MNLKTSLLCATLFATACATASAQAYNTAATDRASYIPYTTAGYVGLDVGQSKYKVGNGNGAFGIDNKDVAFKLYGGGMFNQNLGLEFGYINFGEIDRAGGHTKAQGLNLSLVAKAPIAQSFDVFGKLGTTYAWTRTSSNAASGVQSGHDNGFGLSYGVGASYYFTPQTAVTVGWDSHDLKFAGGNKDRVQVVSVGLRYNY